MVVDGHTGRKHSIPMAHILSRRVAAMAATKVGIHADLGVGYGVFGVRTIVPAHEVWKDQRLISFVPR